MNNDIKSVIVDNQTLIQSNTLYKGKKVATSDIKQNDDILPWFLIMFGCVTKLIFG